MADNVLFSIETCAHCHEIGAEHQLLQGQHQKQYFCHEDCARSALGLPTTARQIGTKLFGEPTLLVGYQLATGQGGYCAHCLERPVEFSAKLLGLPIGVCCKQCASELAADMRTQQISNPQLVEGWLRRHWRHKTYRQREILQSAAWLWMASRAGSAGGDPELPAADDDDATAKIYKSAMMDVFHVLPAAAAASAGKQDAALYFDARFYDSFVAWCRCATDSAYAAAAATTHSKFTNQTMFDGAVPFMQNLADGYDGRKVAEVLYRMFLLYWRRYIRLHRKGGGGNEAIERAADQEPELRQRAPDNCASTERRGRNQHTVHADVTKVFLKLTNKYLLPDLETHHLLKYGLFRALSPELDELSGGGYSSPLKLATIGSELLSPNDPQAIGGLFDSLKRRFRSARETVDFGKKYSASALSRLVLELALLNICVPKHQLPKGLDYDSVANAAAAGVRSAVQGELSVLGFTDPSENLRQFNETIGGVILAKSFRKDSKGKSRDAKTSEQFARICRSSGGKIPIARLSTLALDIAKELSGMVLYWYNDKKPPARGQRFNAHQLLVIRDTEGIFDDLHSKLGTDDTARYLKGLYSQQTKFTEAEHEAEEEETTPDAAAAATAPPPKVPVRAAKQ